MWKNIPSRQTEGFVGAKSGPLAPQLFLVQSAETIHDVASQREKLTLVQFAGTIGVVVVPHCTQRKQATTTVRMQLVFGCQMKQQRRQCVRSPSTKCVAASAASAHPSGLLASATCCLKVMAPESFFQRREAKPSAAPAPRPAPSPAVDATDGDF
jgi:hypothetical protein